MAWKAPCMFPEYPCMCVCARVQPHTVHNDVCSHAFTHAQKTKSQTQTHTVLNWRVRVSRSLSWVVVVLWQCWVLLRTEWRLRRSRRRRGRCWIDTDVCWPWQRWDTPSGSRSAPAHFLSSCPMLIVAWRCARWENTQCQQRVLPVQARLIENSWTTVSNSTL